MLLYHGTSESSAQALLANGWQPHSGAAGSQCGNPKFLYLTNEPENALWYAEQKDDPCVLAIVVPREYLIVDPEDGVGETVEDEMSSPHGLPANLALTKPLPASAFSKHIIPIMGMG